MATASRIRRIRSVVPDRLDLRDRPYQPAIDIAPGASYDAASRLKREDPLPVLDQGDTSACTGFALSNVINWLLRVHRGAMKGWYKHGACADCLWKSLCPLRARTPRATGGKIPRSVPSAPTTA